MSASRNSRVERIRAELERALAPTEIEIVDESHLHAGHEGAKDGKGHFRITIVSERFRGRKPLQCHRMVFDALSAMLKTDIHALSVAALSPEQASTPKHSKRDSAT
jgi:BolA family transcriptional regulator, general stress-responsive regulator